MNRWVLILVLAAGCTKKPTGHDRGGSGASGGSAVEGPSVDTSGWSERALATLGTESFSFEGAIKLPPGAETQTTALYGGDGTTKIGVVAYIDLPGGVRVNVAERDKHAVNDPEIVKRFLQTHGSLVFDRRDATWYMLAVDTGHGLEIQGQFWAVPPGIGCSTQKPVTLEQAELVTAMCASFSARALP